MARRAKPWFRAERGVWFVCHRGKQVNLGEDKAEAFKAFHALMAEPERPAAAPDGSVAALIDAFLDWTQRNCAPRTYDWYQERLQAFVLAIPKNLRVGQLRPMHVTLWFERHPRWSITFRSGCVQAVKRFVNWGVKEGYVERSPLLGLAKPSPAARDNHVSPDEFAAMLREVPEGRFRDVLVVAWETGARPQELRLVEARHVDLKERKWAFPAGESKGKRMPRVVILSAQAVEITRRLVVQRPEGPLFVNEDGKPWDMNSFNNAMSRLQIRQGRRALASERFKISEKEIEALVRKLCPTRVVGGKSRDKTLAELRAEAKRKLLHEAARKRAKKHAIYDFRHSFAHRLLTSGVDPASVATLLGHRDMTLLMRTYGHLVRATDHLHKALSALKSCYA